jgi:hypothetical protein
MVNIPLMWLRLGYNSNFYESNFRRQISMYGYSRLPIIPEARPQVDQRGVNGLYIPLVRQPLTLVNPAGARPAMVRVTNPGFRP